MSRFSAVLRRTAARLDLPQPAKSHLILEMAADVEDLFTAYRKRGLSEEEAFRKVEETFDVSDDALGELTRLHRSAFRRFMDRFSEQAQTRWEKVMLVAILLFVAVTAGQPLTSTEFFGNASGFVWTAMLVGFAAAGVFLAKAYQLYVKKDHTIRRLRTAVPSLLLLTCASLFNGLFGLLFGLYRCMTRIAGDHERAGVYFMDWQVGSTATMILSLLVAILAALCWFVLTNKVRSIELAEAASMLGESP